MELAPQHVDSSISDCNISASCKKADNPMPDADVSSASSPSSSSCSFEYTFSTEPTFPTRKSLNSKQSSAAVANSIKTPATSTTNKSEFKPPTSVQVDLHTETSLSEVSSTATEDSALVANDTNQAYPTTPALSIKMPAAKSTNKKNRKHGHPDYLKSDKPNKRHKGDLRKIPACALCYKKHIGCDRASERDTCTACRKRGQECTANLVHVENGKMVVKDQGVQASGTYFQLYLLS
jgi:hypothetical protein